MQNIIENPEIEIDAPLSNSAQTSMETIYLNYRPLEEFASVDIIEPHEEIVDPQPIEITGDNGNGRSLFNVDGA